MGNWGELGDDILGLIVDQFSAIEDISVFGVVCQQWRSVSVKNWHSSIVDPWLMLAEKEDSDSRGFYSLSTKKVYQLNLPEARGRKCFSSCGWLITLGLDLEIHLFNPFSRTRFQIRLPPQSTFPNQYDLETDSEPDIYDPETDSEPDIYDPETDSETEQEYIRRVFMRKVILSSRPSKRIPCEDHDEKCVVMGMFSKHCKLAFLRLGDEIWTPIYTPEGIGISDVIYMNGQFYALTDGGKLVIVDISSPDPKTIEFAEPPECYNQCAHFYHSHFYLVESVGELFMLARYEDDCEGEDEEFGDGIVEGEYIEYGTHNYDKYFYRTFAFDVHKFNFDNKEWTQVNDLDNRVLFVGDNASFAIFPSNHLGCETNCIYFTDDTCHLMRKYSEEVARVDMGVFRMKSVKVDNHYVGPDTLSHICAPLWICPSL